MKHWFVKTSVIIISLRKIFGNAFDMVIFYNSNDKTLSRKCLCHETILCNKLYLLEKTCLWKKDISMKYWFVKTYVRNNIL